MSVWIETILLKPLSLPISMPMWSICQFLLSRWGMYLSSNTMAYAIVNDHFLKFSNDRPFFHLCRKGHYCLASMVLTIKCFTLRDFFSWPSHRHGITMIYDRWNHSKAPPKKPPLLSYNIYNKVRHEFFDIVPKKRSIQDKNAEEWNNLHAAYFPKDASF